METKYLETVRVIGLIVGLSSIAWIAFASTQIPVNEINDLFGYSALIGAITVFSSEVILNRKRRYMSYG